MARVEDLEGEDEVSRMGLLVKKVEDLVMMMQFWVQFRVADEDNKQQVLRYPWGV